MSRKVTDPKYRRSMSDIFDRLIRTTNVCRTYIRQSVKFAISDPRKYYETQTRAIRMNSDTLVGRIPVTLVMDHRVHLYCIETLFLSKLVCSPYAACIYLILTSLTYHCDSFLDDLDLGQSLTYASGVIRFVYGTNEVEESRQRYTFLIWMCILVFVLTLKNRKVVERPAAFQRITTCSWSRSSRSDCFKWTLMKLKRSVRILNWVVSDNSGSWRSLIGSKSRLSVTNDEDESPIPRTSRNRHENDVDIHYWIL